MKSCESKCLITFHRQHYLLICIMQEKSTKQIKFKKDSHLDSNHWQKSRRLSTLLWIPQLRWKKKYFPKRKVSWKTMRSALNYWTSIIRKCIRSKTTGKVITFCLIYKTILIYCHAVLASTRLKLFANSIQRSWCRSSAGYRNTLRLMKPVFHHISLQAVTQICRGLHVKIMQNTLCQLQLSRRCWVTFTSRFQTINRQTSTTFLKFMIMSLWNLCSHKESQTQFFWGKSKQARMVTCMLLIVMLDLQNLPTKFYWKWENTWRRCSRQMLTSSMIIMFLI